MTTWSRYESLLERGLWGISTTVVQLGEEPAYSHNSETQALFRCLSALILESQPNIMKLVY